MEEKQKQKQKQKQVLSDYQPSILNCNGVPFDLLPFKPSPSPEAPPNTYVLHVNGHQYLIDRHNEEERSVLNCNFIYLTVKQWLDLMKTSIYDEHYGEKRPSGETRDIVKGILLIYLGLDWSDIPYRRGLGDIRNFGLEPIISNFGSDWDSKIRLHHIGTLTPNDSKSHRRCKENIVKVIDSIFLSPTSGTTEYPKFFEHWRNMLGEWVKTDDPEDPSILINHSCWWHWSTRLDYFETLYPAYCSGQDEDRRLKKAIDEVEFEYTGGTEGWVQNIPQNTPFRRIYDGMGKPNLFLYYRAVATGHMHEKISAAEAKLPGARYVKYYKYIYEGGPEENLCKKRKYVEKKLSEMFPSFLDQIAVKIAIPKLNNVVKAGMGIV